MIMIRLIQNERINGKKKKKPSKAVSDNKDSEHTQMLGMARLWNDFDNMYCLNTFKPGSKEEVFV